MHKTMIITAVICLILSAASIVLLNCLEYRVFLSLAITFAVTAYHFGIRLIIGLLYNAVMNNKVDSSKKCFKPHSWEKKLYHIIKVKKWKNKLPTLNPELFSVKDRSYDEIIMAMCQAELVHKTCAVVSFLPVTAAIWFGSFWVFFITSVCAAAFDMMFVAIQRYNRPRVIKAALLCKAKNSQQV